MLEDRLLNSARVNYESELRNVEMLKNRFGESTMHSFVVMLKDIKDSERINAEKKPSAQ